MLIKSIDIENFRIFAGRQHVDFSTNRDKNVTLIMGDNGGGKTTFAQAFSWCLYGTTTFKKADELLSLTVGAEMPVGSERRVTVSLVLEHNDREYHIVRFQDYRKESNGSVKAMSPVLTISYKAEDGQNEPIIDEQEKRDIINEIIPASISSYFFFDGERVEKMGKEIQNGKSKEFKAAVESLLGLSAISSAIRHLNVGSQSVLKSYARDFNASGDEDYAMAVQAIAAAESRIERLEAEIEELQELKNDAQDSYDKYKSELESLRESRAWSKERETLEGEIENLKQGIEKVQEHLLKKFNSESWSFFVAPIFRMAIEAIDHSSIELKEAPTGVNAETISDIIASGECLCGTEVVPGTKVFAKLQSWLELVPPEHMGAAISNFKQKCEMETAVETTLAADIEYYMQEIRQKQNEIIQKETRVEKLASLLESARDSSPVERKLQTAKRKIREYEEQISDKNIAKGMAEANKSDAESKKNSLSVHDETNKRISREMAYAEYIFSTLDAEHKRQEALTRTDLEREINSIFQEFFNGNLELELDDKYNVRVKSRDMGAKEVETSEGQTVAVIFAFIAGVIRLATESKRRDDEMLLTESYPLVMDAPMSKLDKKRIEAICDVVPRIAEQTIIMIKDTDGELAKEYLTPRIGVEYAIVNIEPERKSEIDRK